MELNNKEVSMVPRTLCEQAVIDTARGAGHSVGPWVPVEGEKGHYTASCACGAAIHAHINDGYNVFGDSAEALAHCPKEAR